MTTISNIVQALESRFHQAKDYEKTGLSCSAQFATAVTSPPIPMVSVDCTNEYKLLPCPVDNQSSSESVADSGSNSGWAIKGRRSSKDTKKYNKRRVDEENEQSCDEEFFFEDDILSNRVQAPAEKGSLYKTEMCRSWIETGGHCRYGPKCQFAHGMEELRFVQRHPKYKTESCRTFHSLGTCPYGRRCRFIHGTKKELTHGIIHVMLTGLCREPNTRLPVFETVMAKQEWAEQA
eukprot:Rmarinus@m.27288